MLIIIHIVGVIGLEPIIPPPKRDVLPLHHTPIQSLLLTIQLYELTVANIQIKFHITKFSKLNKLNLIDLLYSTNYLHHHEA